MVMMIIMMVVRGETKLNETNDTDEESSEMVKGVK